MTKRTRPFLVAALLAAVVLAAAGCGGNESSSADQAATQAAKEATNPPPSVTETTTPTTKAEKVAPGPGEGDLKTKPKIPKQTGKPPTELVVQDLIVGKGRAAESGDTVSVQYVGVLYDNGKEFDSSWKRNEPFEFPLGGGQVIPGWDEGVVGMKVGGRRRLIIPADLAYGPQGQPPTIPPNAALVFDVDLEKIT